jgi:hypothetical protein
MDLCKSNVLFSSLILYYPAIQRSEAQGADGGR